MTDVASMVSEWLNLRNESIQRVNDGSELVHQSGKTLEEIVHSAKKVSGIEQTNTVVRQMDPSTQQNAAFVEQMAGTTRLVERRDKRALSPCPGIQDTALRGGEGQDAGGVLAQSLRVRTPFTSPTKAPRLERMPMWDRQPVVGLKPVDKGKHFAAD